MDNEQISIIILSYKNKDSILEVIDSVLIQDYKNIELLIGDDGTEGFNREYYQDYIYQNAKSNIKNVIIYTNNKNLGTVKNANKALNLCSGKYIKFIGADDKFYSESILSKVVEFMRDNEELIVSSNLMICDKNMNELPYYKEYINQQRKLLELGNKPSKMFKELCTGRTIAPGIFFTRKFFEKYGSFDENYILLEDWPTWLKISRNGCSIGYVDLITVRYRIDGGISNSSNINPILKNDLIRCYENEIFPFKHELGIIFYRKIKYQFKKQFETCQYSKLKKIMLKLKYIDVIIFNKIIRRGI